MNVEIIGWLAVAVNSFIFLPQIIKIIKTKRIRELSFFMLLIQILSCFLWITYGIFIKNWEVVSLDLIILISTITILGLSLIIIIKSHNKKVPKLKIGTKVFRGYLEFVFMFKLYSFFIIILFYKK